MMAVVPMGDEAATKLPVEKVREMRERGVARADLDLSGDKTHSPSDEAAANAFLTRCVIGGPGY